MDKEIEHLNLQAQEYSKRLKEVLNEIRRVIVGQESVLEKLLLCLVANGHVLLEGVPGLSLIHISEPTRPY